MDTNEMIALLLPPNGCYKCSDTRKEIAEELARRSVDLERECADADKICAALGLTVERSRTEGGALNVPRIVAHINETLTALRESHAFGVAMSDKYVAQVRATAREPETISEMIARHDRESREAILRTHQRMTVPPAQAERAALRECVRAADAMRAVAATRPDGLYGGHQVAAYDRARAKVTLA